MQVKILFMIILIILENTLITVCSKNTETVSVKTEETDQTENDKQQSIQFSGNNGMWSKLLEDYTLSKTSRVPKVMQTPSSPSSSSSSSTSSSHRYIPTSGFYISKRIGEAMELEPHKRPPGKIILSQNFQNLNQQNIGGYDSLNYQNHRQPSSQFREVSETDLYLLGAIEKLVYRVDYMENRLRRAEQLIYYLMAGNNQKESKESCPFNFTKIGDNCYYIAGDVQYNWKTANNACKSMNSHLAEFENLSEMEDIIAYLLNHLEHRGKDFWLGGLNPGLLWIWSNSAKPVNPNTNLTSFTSSTNLNQNNSTDEKNTEENRILNNSIEIKGNGRCLRLSYNPSKHSYQYYGQECTSRHHYLCEFEDRTLDNKIIKISKSLNLN